MLQRTYLLLFALLLSSLTSIASAVSLQRSSSFPSATSTNPQQAGAGQTPNSNLPDLPRGQVHFQSQQARYAYATGSAAGGTAAGTGVQSSAGGAQVSPGHHLQHHVGGHSQHQHVDEKNYNPKNSKTPTPPTVPPTSYFNAFSCTSEDLIQPASSLLCSL